MRQPKREGFVPVGDLNPPSRILLESPPPYRKSLQIDVGTLTGLLGLVGADEDLVKLNFERRQPVVRAAPSSTGGLTAATRETPFKEEKSPGLRRVAYDPRREKLLITVAYLDQDVKTPEVTARTLSRRLTRALSIVPTVKYCTNLLEDLREEPVSGGRAAEVVLHTARMAATALGAPIVYGILEVATHTPHPWETLGILAVLNAADIVMDLDSALKLKTGKRLDENRILTARAVAQNLSRAFYPASLVHECLLPTARYLIRQAATPTQLLRAGEK